MRPFRFPPSPTKRAQGRRAVGEPGRRRRWIWKWKNESPSAVGSPLTTDRKARLMRVAIKPKNEQERSAEELNCRTCICRAPSSRQGACESLLCLPNRQTMRVTRRGTPAAAERDCRLTVSGAHCFPLLTGHCGAIVRSYRSQQARRLSERRRQIAGLVCVVRPLRDKEPVRASCAYRTDRR